MTENIELSVYRADNLTVAEDIISRRTSPTMLEEHNQKGGGSFKLLSSDELALEPGLLVEGKIIGVRVGGLLIGYWEIQKINTVLIDVGGKSAEFKEYSGPTVYDWLTHAIMLPWDAVAGADDREFNYASPRGDWYKAADWKAPVVLESVRLGNPPKDWPEALDASWIWNAVGPAAAGDVFFRREFTTTAEGSYRMVGTAGDYMVALIDGIRVFTVTEFSAIDRTFSADFDLPAGKHVLAIRGRKANNSNTRGMIGLAMLRRSEDSESSQVEDSKNADRVLWTGDTGGWVMNAYPKTPPGFTVGGILTLLIEEAKARGVEAMTRLRPTFTAALDSYGNAWPGTVDPAFAVGSTLEEVVSQITDSYADVWISPDGRLNAAVQRGYDLSTGDNPISFRKGRNVLGASTESTAEISNTVFVKSGTGIVENAGPAASLSKYGRRETYLSAVNASSDGSVPYLVKQLFDKFAQPRRTPTLTIHPDDDSTPWVDFGVGDWVLAPSDEDASKLISRRVVSIAVGEDSDTGRPIYTVELDTIQETLENRLARWLQELGNTSKSGGVSGTSSGSASAADIPNLHVPGWTGTGPLNPSPKRQIPTAPTGVKVTADLYTPIAGTPDGRLLATWTHDGFDNTGKAMEVRKYEVWGRVQGANQDWQRIAESTTMRASISGLPTRNTDGVALTWEVMVYAYGPTGEQSPASTVVATAMQQDKVAPLKPSTPTLSVQGTAVTARWDFKDLNGAAMPTDFSHAVVEALNSTTWVAVGTLMVPGDQVLFSGFGYGSQSVRVTAYDLSNNKSPVSDVAKIDTKKLVDTDLILSEIDAGKTAIKNAGKVLLETGQTLTQKLASADETLAVTRTLITGPGGLAERLEDTEELLADAGSLMFTTGQTLRQKLAEGDTAIANTKADLTKVTDRVTPLESGLTTLTGTTIPGLQASVDGKTAILRKTAAPGTADTSPAGTRWEHWSNLNANGKLMGTYRRSESNTWIKDALDPTYIPLLDIGTATVGSLSGGRLVAGSVSADKVMIGLGENLLVDPSFEDAVISQRRVSSTPAWSWVQDTLGGSYLFTDSAVLGDLAIGNSSNSEMFPIDPQGAMAFTVDAEGPDLLQVYMQVRYADGTAATGPYLKDLKTGGTRKTVTVQWDFSTAARGATGSPPVTARPVLRRKAETATVTGANKVYSVRFAPATKGELIVNGTIVGDHIHGESVAAKVGKFISLGVEQLTVTGTANLQTAVADRLFANIFATNRLTTNHLIVGKGENLIPWFTTLADSAQRTWAPHVGLNGTELKFEGTGGRTNATHGLINAPQVVSGTSAFVLQFSPGTKAKNGLANYFDVEPNTKYKVSLWVKSGGTYPSGVPNVYINAQSATGAAAYESGSATISKPVKLSSVWQEIKHEFTTMANSASVMLRLSMDQPGHVRIEDPMLVKDGASLIATGGILADHITASESMSAKIAQFLTLGVDKLTVTGTANLQTAVADKLFANIFATNRLTASQVLIGEGGNFLGDPNFLDAAGWNNGAAYISLLGGRNSNNAYVIPASTGQVGGYYGSQDRNRQFTVVPDSSYKLSVWVKPDAEVPVAAVAMYMKWTTPTGPASGTAFSEPGNIANTEVLPAGVWSKIAGIVKLPSDAVKGFIGLYVQKTANVRVAFSEPSVVQAVDTALVVDGAIVTKQLKVTEDMTVELLKAHKVEADEIDTNSLAADAGFVSVLGAKIITADLITADLLDADAITSKHTITGAVLRTDAAANKGIQIDSVGLRAWSDTGMETFYVSRSTGNVRVYDGTITGGVVQTTDVANRGLKITTSGLAAYDAGGKLTFLLDAADGDAQFDSRVMFGRSVDPHWVVVPWESVSQERAGLWLVQGNSSGIGGEETAGIYMDNSNATFANPLVMRGMNGGGVTVYGRFNSSDMYSGTIHHASGNYELRGSNGSYFNSQVIFNGRIQYAGAPATTAAANAHMASDGTIWKSSSASRFKIDQKVSELPDSLLDLDFKDWIDKGQIDQYVAISRGPQPLTKEDSETLRTSYLGRVGGVVAEDVEAAAGSASSLFVTYDSEGRIEGVSYDRLGVALALKLADKVNELAAELAALKGEN